MKTLIMIIITIHAAQQQSFTEQILSDSGQKSAEEVTHSLSCVKDSKWNTFFLTNFSELGIQGVRDKLYKCGTPNKKYYLPINDSHNIMYFKIGNDIFVNLNKIQEDGTEHVIMRGFMGDNFENCIKLLPESCKWKGQREVKFIHVCEEGLIQAKGFTYGVLNIFLDEQVGQFSPFKIVRAVRDCYKPKTHSISYKCFEDGLNFDLVQAKKYLENVRDDMIKRGFKASLDMDTLSIKFQKLSLEYDEFHVEVMADTWDYLE
jgi:hypothetical protein